MCKISVTLLIIILFFWINMWHSEIIQTALKWCITTKDLNTNDNINNNMLINCSQFLFQKVLMITYQSIPSYWASSQAQAYFRLEIIFSNSINKPLKGPYFDCWYFLCLASKRTPIDISEPVVWHVYWSAVFRCNSCHFNISRWMSAISTMHWRS